MCFFSRCRICLMNTKKLVPYIFSPMEIFYRFMWFLVSTYYFFCYFRWSARWLSQIQAMNLLTTKTFCFDYLLTTKTINIKLLEAKRLRAQQSNVNPDSD